MLEKGPSLPSVALLLYGRALGCLPPQMEAPSLTNLNRKKLSFPLAPPDRSSCWLGGFDTASAGAYCLSEQNYRWKTGTKVGPCNTAEKGVQDEILCNHTKKLAQADADAITLGVALLFELESLFLPPDGRCVRKLLLNTPSVTGTGLEKRTLALNSSLLLEYSLIVEHRFECLRELLVEWRWNKAALDAGRCC